MSRVVLSDAAFLTLRRVLARTAGLVFDESRRESIAFSVAERLHATGLSSVADYLALVDGRGGDPVERQRLVDAVTIQETHFFRNPPQVRALRQTVLPGLADHAQQAGRALRVWSAGCSTGEEPYSLAMLLREVAPTARADVLATDVSERALAAARRAVYGRRAVQMATPDQLGRFFVEHGNGTYGVRPAVSELVRFAHHNLVTDLPPYAEGEVDLVLCRNVTIYFGRDTTRELVRRFARVLRPGGFLFLGHSETLWRVSQEFGLVTLGTGDSAAFVYRRLPADRTHKVDERRSVLPDRRTGSDPTPSAGPDRRRGLRRLPALVDLTVGESVAALPEAVDPVALPTDGIEAARSALQCGRYEQAAELAALVAADAPLLADAHYLRGVALASLGRDPEALTDLRKAVYLEPSDGFAHFLLAGVLGRLGDPLAAAREYAAAADTLGRRPGDTTAPELGGRSVDELRALCLRLSRVDP